MFLTKKGNSYEEDSCGCAFIEFVLYGVFGGLGVDTGFDFGGGGSDGVDTLDAGEWACDG